MQLYGLGFGMSCRQWMPLRPLHRHCWSPLGFSLIDMDDRIALQIVDRLEAITRLKTFNLLGGLQIERDVRQLINAASEITQMPVRDRFAKLSQMSTMLAIENVAEMQDFWGANSDSISWRFNQLQVREVLRQRSDLDRSEISRSELTR